MAYKGDILNKYKEEYPAYESRSINRLNQLKRSFSNEKNNYKEKTKILNQKLEESQTITFNRFNMLYQTYEKDIKSLRNVYQDINSEFNMDIYSELKALDEDAENEHALFEEILEDFETRRQDAIDIYLRLTKENNDQIDNDMKVHKAFLIKEQKKLSAFKTSYDDLNAKLNNRLLWTIEKSKNAINQLENDLSAIEKSDLISLNKKIIKSLSDMRGTRNDINSMFKETSSVLQDYKEDIYKIRKAKQRPYSEINQKLIQKLVKQIRLANDNKSKYQTIINDDLKNSKNKIYPLIIKANQNHDKDQLEKYILQSEALEHKAKFLNQKIDKITSYNISIYQNRIKEIKVEAFTRNEEIKYTYSVPIKFIENSVNIYSNYNFYFNQGFNDLDKLLTQLIDFSQIFNDIRDKEILTNKKDFSDYQNTLLAKITEVSEKLSELLYNIDEIAFKITTLESQYRLNIAEIKKDIVNVDIKGDYLKFIESLNTDFEIANNHYKNRLKKINIHKLYKDKILEIYKRSTDLNQEIKLIEIDQSFNQEFIKIETHSHREIYDNLSSQLDNFYTYETKLTQVFMNMMKEKVIQSVKATNYQLVKNYYNLLNQNNHSLINEENALVKFIKRMQKYIESNNQNQQMISNFLVDKNKTFSLEKYFSQTKDKLLSQINSIENKKTTSINNKIIEAFIHKKKISHLTQQKMLNLIDYCYKLLQPEENPKISEALAKKNFIYTLDQFTLIYYDLLNYLYQYTSNNQITELNNFYDDFIVDFTEKYIKTYDTINGLKNQKKKTKALNEYFIYASVKLNRVFKFMNRLIHASFDSTLDKFANQLAVIKINVNNHKSYVEFEYNHLEHKSSKTNKKIKYQQNLIKKFINDINNFITAKVIDKNDKFTSKKSKEKNKFKYLEKQIKKIVIFNDKKLIQLLKNIDEVISSDYDLLLKDYKYRKTHIEQQLQKLINDTKIESEYNTYIMNEFRSSVINTRNQLLRQLEVLPSEKQARLSSIELDNQKAFDKNYQQLMMKYAKIEREKFSKTPMLEEKITLEEQKVSEEYSALYERHKNLEENYLNQYVYFNNQFTDYHHQFRDGKIKKTLSFDHDLNQPLVDLLETQSSMINITKTIHKETLLKTQSTINEINKEKTKSDKKQSRIINS